MRKGSEGVEGRERSREEMRKKDERCAEIKREGDREECRVSV